MTDKPKLTVDLDDMDIDLTKFSRADLDKIPYDKVPWVCRAEGCTNQVMIRNYGYRNLFYWRRRWINIRKYYYLCSKHTKFFKNNIPFTLKPPANE